MCPNFESSFDNCVVLDSQHKLEALDRLHVFSNFTARVVESDG